MQSRRVFPLLLVIIQSIQSKGSPPEWVDETTQLPHGLHCYARLLLTTQRPYFSSENTCIGRRRSTLGFAACGNSNGGRVPFCKSMGTRCVGFRSVFEAIGRYRRSACTSHQTAGCLFRAVGRSRLQGFALRNELRAWGRAGRDC